MAVTILRAGPAVTVQDMGRPGWLAQGLSCGGAMDRLALLEGAALLGQSESLAALEIAGSFLTLQTEQEVRLALTGAPMRALCDGAPLVWHAVHAIPAGAHIEVTALTGGYGYLSFGGGIDTPHMLGSRSAHLAAGIGRALDTGDRLPLGADPGTRTGIQMSAPERFSGGRICFTAGPQTQRFDPDTLARFQNTRLTKDTRANRMGQRLLGGSFAAEGGLSILSDAVLPGDIQITGDGTAFVLLAECQTTGGYPRIGRVLPVDLPRLVQAPAGAELTFELVDQDTALKLERAEAERRKPCAPHFGP
jgi:5-oxoprolinase (ATP-hydrolysing) subunit C